MLNFLRKMFGRVPAGPPNRGPEVRRSHAGQNRDESGLRDSEEQFAQLVASVHDYAVFLLNRRGFVLSWNAGAERIKGYRREEIVGQHFSRFYPAEAVATGWPTHELEVASVTGRFEDEGWRIRKDGSRFWANVVITALREESGEVRGFLKITRDLTDRKYAEEKLRLSEERFRLLVEGVQDYAIFMLDPEGRVATWNEGAERIKGYTAEEIIGDHISRFYPQEAVDRGWPQEELRRAAQDGRFKEEGWRIRKDGSRFWADVVITALRDDKGDLCGFSKVTRDLTERQEAEENTHRLLQEEAARKAAETAAREIERQRVQLHVTLSSIGDAVIVTDHRGDVTFLNPVAASLTGWESAEASGQPLDRVFQIINEHTRRAVENPVHRVFRENAVVELANHTALLTRDGRQIPIEDSAAPIRTGADEISGAVLVFRDVTESRRAREARLRLAAIVESSDDAIIGMDLEGIVTSWNQGAERLYGYTVDEIVGKAVSLLIPDDHPNDLTEILQRTRRGDRIAHFETVRQRKDGGRLNVSLTISPIRDADGTVTGAAKIARDITETKRAEAALRESEERLAAELESITRLHALSARLLISLDVRSGLEDILREAIRASHADLGNIQLYNRSVQAMEIAVQQGFRDEFLEHFRVVRMDEGSACAQAMERGERFIIEDVEQDSSFKPHRRIAAAAGFRAVQSTPLMSRSGNVIGMLSTHFRQPHRPSARDQRLLDLHARHAADLLERHSIEEALRRSEAEFRQLADAMPQIVWTAGADGEIDYSNARWYKFTGFSVGVGNKNWNSIVHPEDMPKAAALWAESLRDGTAFEMEIRLLERQSSAYRWHLMRTVPVHNDERLLVRWYGTATDITEQKRASQSAQFLAEASAALATIGDYESTLQTVARLAVPYFADWSSVDLIQDDGSLRRLAITHQVPEKARIGQELLRRYPPDRNASGGIGFVVRTGQPEIVEDVTDEMLMQVARDPEHLRLIRLLGLRSYICVPLVVSGKSIGVLTFATAESGRTYRQSDLSLAEDLAHRAAIAVENANLYQALREEDQRKSEFLAMLAHELRNPLAPLRNGLEVLRLARPHTQSVEQARVMMERQLFHLVRLVDDLLDVSRISRGKIELRKERVPLSLIVESAVETCTPMIKQQDDELTITLPAEPVYVDADRTRMAQALCNLLSNAVKYSDRGTPIWLSVERHGNEAVIRVKDKGIGIPEAMLPRVFDLFTQVDRSLEKSQGGLGIGLTIVKRLIEMHGGSVEASSEGQGKGSEFVIRLPVVALAGPAPEKNPVAHQTPLAVRHRILVVDDNVDSASSLAMLLQLMGNDVNTAHDGLTALEIAEEFRPDLILMDIGMPKLNGYETCRRIRAQSWGKSAVIVALTGWGQDEDKRRSQEAGFSSHLVKPIELPALENLLRTIQKGA